MKVLLMSLLVSSVSLWCTTKVATACEKHGDVEVKVVAVGDGAADCDGAIIKFALSGGEDGEMIWVTGDGDDDEHVFMINVSAIADGDDDFTWIAKVGGDDGRSEKHGTHNVVLRRFGEDKDRGWLGVSIGNVSDALADQLDLDGEGVIIQNVIDGSPADKGGLKVNDVILEIEGDAVNGDVMRAIELVKAHKPDQEVDILVLRNGREKELTVTLGSRSKMGKVLIWKGEVAPDAEFEERIRTFGKMMRRGDDGEWVFEDLGDLKALKHLPMHLQLFLPKSGSRTTQVFVENGAKRIRTEVVEDGNVIIVEQDGDGEITVTRVDEDGNETEDTYADREELEDADPEAYALIQGMNDHVIVIDDGDGVHDFDFHFAFDADQWKEKWGDWEDKLEESLSQIPGIQEEAMEKLHKVLERLKIEGFDGADFDFHELPKIIGRAKGLPGLAHVRALHFGKPKHTFEVQKDGTIEVRIRRGDSELVQRFEDEDDLEDRRPKLYEKYRDLMDAEDE